MVVCLPVVILLLCGRTVVCLLCFRSGGLAWADCLATLTAWSCLLEESCRAMATQCGVLRDCLGNVASARRAVSAAARCLSCRQHQAAEPAATPKSAGGGDEGAHRKKKKKDKKDKAKDKAAKKKEKTAQGEATAATAATGGESAWSSWA